MHQRVNKRFSFSTHEKIAKAFNVRLLAAECQNILAEVQFSALTQLDFLILLQKGIFHIFQKLQAVGES